MFYHNENIYVLTKIRCPRCGFAYLEGKKVGTTSLTGAVEPQVLILTHSPFYKGYGRVFNKESIILYNSRGGGDYIECHYDTLVKLKTQWVIVADKIIYKTDIEPYWRDAIPHQYQIYVQTGGDRGSGTAYLVSPLEYQKQKIKLCKICVADVQEVRKKRENNNWYKCDQKIGCMDITYNPKERRLKCGDIEVSAGPWCVPADYKKYIKYVPEYITMDHIRVAHIEKNNNTLYINIL